MSEHERAEQPDHDGCQCPVCQGTDAQITAFADAVMALTKGFSIGGFVTMAVAEGHVRVFAWAPPDAPMRPQVELVARQTSQLAKTVFETEGRA